MLTLRRHLFVLAAITAMFCCAAASFALDPFENPRGYGVQSWQAASGLPQNTVHAALQTSNGYMWFATEAGVARFDGERFTVFTHEDMPQLPSDLVYALMEGRDGALWIGTANGVASYRYGVFHAYPETESSAVWSLFQDREGRVWALSSSGLMRLEGSRFVDIIGVPSLDETSRMLEPLDGSLWIATTGGLFHAAPGNATYFTLAGSAEPVQTLAVGPDNRIWAGTQDGVETCAQPAASPIGPSAKPKTTPATPACSPYAPLTGQDVRAMAVTARGGIWIGADGGLWFVGRDAKNPQPWTTKDGLPSTAISRLFCDREGALWVSTDKGLARVFRGKVTALGPREGLAEGHILAFVEDREGNLWLGTGSDGVTILRDRKFITYGADDGITNDNVLAVTGDGAGNVWLGTNGGGLYHSNLKTVNTSGFSALTVANGLASNIVFAVAAAPAGVVWVGTPDGLDRLQSGHVTTFTTADGLADDFIRSLHVDPQGNLWIGTRRGLTEYKDGKFLTWTAQNGLGSDVVGAMVDDKDGGLWIGTMGGLTHEQNSQFRNYGTHDGLSNPIVTALCEDADGTLWIGTDGGGLDRMRNGVIQPVRLPGLPRRIYGILADREGGLWISSRLGINRVSRAALNAYLAHKAWTVRIALYGVSDGMRIREASSGGHPAAWQMADGTLWFATLKGVSVANPAHLPVNRVPPPVTIESFHVDDQPLSASTWLKPGAHPLSIAAGSRRFAFDYAALSFTSPGEVRFRYRLKGFDHAWIDAGSRRSAYYTNLPPGHYTFEVMAANNDGVSSAAPAVLRFNLSPYFYQTIWFYILLAIVAALIGYLIYLWRVRQVESRFRAVLNERNRIAREIHDTLAQGFVAVNVQLQVAERTLPAEARTEGARGHLKQAQELVRAGIEDARRAIWELRSQNAGNSDLAARLGQMAARLTENTGIRAEVEARGTYRPLPERTEEELLRIAREAVTNAVRHAAPARIDLTLEYSRRGISMTIADDGRGFTSVPADGHYGLTGMKERAQQIGGSVTVTSSEGEGTRVLVEAPAGSRTS